MGYLIVAVVAVAVAVFAMQNTAPVDVDFLVWKIAQVPVAAVVLASLAAGLVIAGVPLAFQLWRARRHARTLESEVRREAAAAEAARAALAARVLDSRSPAEGGPPTPRDRPAAGPPDRGFLDPRTS
jgi:uncharacterized integral membrane protein